LLADWTSGRRQDDASEVTGIGGRPGSPQSCPAGGQTLPDAALAVVRWIKAGQVAWKWVS